MNIIIDLIFVAVIVFCIIASAKKGFVKVLVETVGFVAALYLAFTLSSPLANLTYDKIIEPPIVTAITESGAETASQIVEKTIDALPEFISQGLNGLDKEIENQISTNGISSAAATITETSQTVIKPVVTKILGLIYFLPLAVILLIVVKFLAKIINKLFSFSIIGTANKILGAILGLIKGIIISLVISAAISLVIGFNPNGFLIFTSANLAKSFMFGILSGFNPFII